MVQLLLLLSFALFCSAISLRFQEIVDKNAGVQMQTSHSSSSSARETFYESNIDVTLLRPRKTFVTAAFIFCHFLASLKCLSTVGAPLRSAILALDKTIKNGEKIISLRELQSESSNLPSGSLPSARSLVQIMLSLCCHFFYVHLLKKIPRFARTAQFAETSHLGSATHVFLEKKEPRGFDNIRRSKEVIVPLSTTGVISVDQCMSILLLVPTAIHSLNADTRSFNNRSSVASNNDSILEARTIEFDDMKYFIFQDAKEKSEIISKKFNKRGSRKAKRLKLIAKKPRKKVLKRRESPIIVIAATPQHQVSLHGLKEIHHRLHQFDHKMLDEFGLTSESAAERLKVYGENGFSIPLPTLRERFMNHILAPMYVLRTVFQFLFILEEPFQAPVMRVIITLLTDSIDIIRISHHAKNQLKSMDGTSVKSEITNQIKGCTVIRDGKLKIVLIADIVPGDIVYLSDGPVPADCLVLEGSCVVNEAILTGETVPQPKTAMDMSVLSIIDDSNSDTDYKTGDGAAEGSSGHLCIQKHHSHVLFRGSEIIQTTAFIKSECSLSKTHFRGLVLRTGFSSTQGSLYRNMKAMDSRAGGAGDGLLSSRQQVDFLRLLLLLGVSAVGASLAVYWNGQSRGWSHHRLLVQAARIFVSMASPDIQKDITFTVAATSRRLTKEEKVYCTDPSKMAVAGMVTACLFDKTGTISTDRVVAEKAITLNEVQVNGDVPVSTKSMYRMGGDKAGQERALYRPEGPVPESGHSVQAAEWVGKDSALSASPLGLQTVVACCHSVMELLPLSAGR